MHGVAPLWEGHSELIIRMDNREGGRSALGSPSRGDVGGASEGRCRGLARKQLVEAKALQRQDTEAFTSAWQALQGLFDLFFVILSPLPMCSLQLKNTICPICNEYGLQEYDLQ